VSRTSVCLRASTLRRPRCSGLDLIRQAVSRSSWSVEGSLAGEAVSRKATPTWRRLVSGGHTAVQELESVLSSVCSTPTSNRASFASVIQASLAPNGPGFEALMASTYRLGPSPVAVGPPTSAIMSLRRASRWENGGAGMKNEAEDEETEGLAYRLSWLLAAASRRRPHAEAGGRMRRR
jgi:hypothetical protein